MIMIILNIKMINDNIEYQDDNGFKMEIIKDKYSCRYCKNTAKNKVRYGCCSKCWALIDQPNRIKRKKIKQQKWRF